jgi:hypothetical protein
MLKNIKKEKAEAIVKKLLVINDFVGTNCLVPILKEVKSH